MKDKILQIITIPDVLKKYGYETNDRRRIKCFFHGGTHKNLGYTDKIYNCFVCGKSGNAISLVMQLHNLDFKSALIRINYDFNLNITSDRPSYKDIIKAREIAKQREADKRKQIEQDKLYLDLVKYRYDVWASGGNVEFIDRILDTEDKETICYLAIDILKARETNYEM